VRLSIPERVDHVHHRMRFGLPAPAFDRTAYRARNVIERAVGWFKQARRLATRAEKLAAYFRALIALALSVRYAGQYLSGTTWAAACTDTGLCSPRVYLRTAAMTRWPSSATLVYGPVFTALAEPGRCSAKSLTRCIPVGSNASSAARSKYRPFTTTARIFITL
jgi:hypothetical protein